MRYVTASALFLSYFMMGILTLTVSGKFRTIFDDMLKGEPLPTLTAILLRTTEGGIFSPIMAISVLLASATASWHFYDCIQDEKNNSKNARLSFLLSLVLLLLLSICLVVAMFLPMIAIMQKL